MTLGTLPIGWLDLFPLPTPPLRAADIHADPPPRGAPRGDIPRASAQRPAAAAVACGGGGGGGGRYDILGGIKHTLVCWDLQVALDQCMKILMHDQYIEY